MNTKLDQFAPKYRQIASRLHQRIRDHQYASHLPLPTEAALMEEFGCSRSTVREALDVLVSANLLTRRQGKGTFLNVEGTRVRKSTLIFSYPSVASLQHPFLGRIFHAFEQGVEAYAQQSQREISVQCIRQAKIEGTRFFTLIHAEDPLQARMIDPNHVQGLCLTCSIKEDEYVEIQKRGVHCVALGGPGLTKVPTVYYNQDRLYDLTFNHLLQLGHMRIGLVAAELFLDDEQTVDYQAYRTGMDRRNLPIEPHWIVACGNYDRGLAADAAHVLLSSGERPTAVICQDDYIALGVRDAAESLDLRVPGDLSIVGAGDYLVDSTLTSVRTPLTRLGQTAARNLCRLVFEDASPASARQQVSGHELIVRGSTGPAPHF